VLATRSSDSIDWKSLIRACSDADIVVSERWLPRSCTTRWLKLDRKSLEQTGGLAIYLKRDPHVETVAVRLGQHPWAE
jgi:competence protein ComEC